MKPEEMIKIQGLCQKMFRIRYKGKKIERGPYWYGWYMKDGKQTEVYIGKDLPIHLQWLIDGRVKLPGRKHWSWPAQEIANRQGTQTPAPTQEA